MHANTTPPHRFLWLQSLHPGNFAMVMASGIVSLGLSILGQRVLAQLPFAVALVAWCVLVLLSSARLALYPQAVMDELRNPRIVFTYFTLVAATGVLGVLFHTRGLLELATACWVLAFVVWCALLYLAFTVLALLTHENNVNVVHGGWLIAIVGTQSLVLLGTRIAPSLHMVADYMMVQAHMLWGVGLILYGIFVTLFCYRIFFSALRPEDMSPLLWVVMGAAAISANAGTSLMIADTHMPFLLAQRPMIDGVTLMVWSWATWWIPLLVVFFFWKHWVRGLPVVYEPVMWSLVFPLGMYSVASARLGLATDFAPLGWVASVMIWVAFAAWSGTFFALLRRLWRAAPGIFQPS